MTAREQVLRRIRAAIGPRQEDAARMTVHDRLAARHGNLVPQAARVTGAARLEQFRAKADAAGMTTEQAARLEDVPEAVKDYLRQRNDLAGEIVIAPHPLLDELPWQQALGQDPHHGRAHAADGVGISIADLAMAETGTLMFLSGPAMPTTLHFVPETEIVILRQSTIVGGMEDAWAYLRLKHHGDMPRAVNLVTGPSRTADIELTLTMGAHGPRHLHVILIAG